MEDKGNPSKGGPPKPKPQEVQKAVDPTPAKEKEDSIESSDAPAPENESPDSANVGDEDKMEVETSAPPSPSEVIPGKSFSDAGQTNLDRGEDDEPRESPATTPTDKVNPAGKTAPLVDAQISSIFEVASVMKPMAANQYQITQVTGEIISDIPATQVKEAFKQANIKEIHRLTTIIQKTNSSFDSSTGTVNGEHPTPENMKSLENYIHWISIEALKAVFIEIYPVGTNETLFYPHLFLRKKYKAKEHDTIMSTIQDYIKNYMNSTNFNINYESKGSNEKISTTFKFKLLNLESYHRLLILEIEYDPGFKASNVEILDHCMSEHTWKQVGESIKVANKANGNHVFQTVVDLETNTHKAPTYSQANKRIFVKVLNSNLIKCTKCDGIGHFTSQCPLKCTTCGFSGHESPNCSTPYHLVKRFQSKKATKSMMDQTKAPINFNFGKYAEKNMPPKADNYGFKTPKNPFKARNKTANINQEYQPNQANSPTKFSNMYDAFNRYNQDDGFSANDNKNANASQDANTFQFPVGKSKATHKAERKAAKSLQKAKLAQQQTQAAQSLDKEAQDYKIPAETSKSATNHHSSNSNAQSDNIQNSSSIPKAALTADEALQKARYQFQHGHLPKTPVQNLPGRNPREREEDYTPGTAAMQSPSKKNALQPSNFERTNGRNSDNESGEEDGEGDRNLIDDDAIVSSQGALLGTQFSESDRAALLPKPTGEDNNNKGSEAAIKTGEAQTHNQL
ncbi:hypothetical protein BN7_6192 [Wickerhamomyces ciferrii]|uniref:CCHC-type domain-containing protein n=1 Tax=Wickerhamomyces ciferrii (strain ATCC 14091 / BCRC 22168 / CBS 111 / JCM 3599 / NBRC 0793 / NRRL Y-1031 F-60-10) TaxID=1206466 RepID=K0KZL5_WICCF|nr:uncharacterized protein BN7_6192 [Wickerhamomyces ciferrii]CCH46598.1 hypothetical protein BN7_6192 [Wickerhamomyces ciferrii]